MLFYACYEFHLFNLLKIVAGHTSFLCLETVKHANWNKMLRIVCCSSVIWQNRKRKMEMEELSVQQLHHRQETEENVHISHQRNVRKVSIGKRLRHGFVKNVVRSVEQSAKEPIGKNTKTLVNKLCDWLLWYFELVYNSWLRTADATQSPGSLRVYFSWWKLVVPLCSYQTLASILSDGHYSKNICFWPFIQAWL